jgi:hypothetical protein
LEAAEKRVAELEAYALQLEKELLGMKATCAH